MKKLLFFLLVSLILSSATFGEDSWKVAEKQASKYISIKQLISEIDGQKWTIRSYVKPDKFFNSSLKSGREVYGFNSYMDVVPEISENEFELFKFDCELEACTVTGFVELGFQNIGAFYRIEPIFHLQSYKVEENADLPTVLDIYELMIGKNVYHSQPVKYLDRNQIVFNWDPQDTWYPEQILVLLDWEDRNILRDFIAECYEKCANLKVYGEIHNKSGGYGDLAIFAHKVEKVD